MSSKFKLGDPVHRSQVAIEAGVAKNRETGFVVGIDGHLLRVGRKPGDRRGERFAEIFWELGHDLGGWEPLDPQRCDLCNRDATWRNAAGGFRCDRCPRPAP